jgi:hypothetical protein
MADKTVIEDVREAKIWLDGQSSSLAEHVKRLERIERAYAERSGEFAHVATAQTAAVRALIEAAADEPGRGLLGETRPSKAG